MIRILPTILALLIALPAMHAAAQTPVATPAVTPDPFMLPVNHLVLRITEGNGFSYVRDATGGPYYDNIHIIDDGVFPDDLPAFLADIYTDVGMQDMYYMYVSLIPDAPFLQPRGLPITVEMRLITVADGDSAARLVEVYPDILRPPLTPGEPPAEITVIADPPAHDEAIVGVTGRDPYFDIDTGEPVGIEVPYARLIAQAGTIVASAKVTSTDPAFNDAVARQLLAAQLDCLTAEGVCVPIALPAGVPYEPAPPVASPVAIMPETRQPIARSRA